MRCTCTAIKRQRAFFMQHYSHKNLSVVQRLIILMFLFRRQVFTMQGSRKSFVWSTTFVAIVIDCFMP